MRKVNLSEDISKRSRSQRQRLGDLKIAFEILRKESIHGASGDAFITNEASPFYTDVGLGNDECWWGNLLSSYVDVDSGLYRPCWIDDCW